MKYGHRIPGAIYLSNPSDIHRLMDAFRSRAEGARGGMKGERKGREGREREGRGKGG